MTKFDPSTSVYFAIPSFRNRGAISGIQRLLFKNKTITTRSLMSAQGVAGLLGQCYNSPSVSALILKKVLPIERIDELEISLDAGSCPA